ncbi:MAG: hypothetical protein ABIH08_00215 [Candidatus Omnitrophota bacterium]
MEILKTIGSFFLNIFKPVIILAKLISKEHYKELLFGIGCLLGWSFFHRLGLNFRKKAQTTSIKLGMLKEREILPGIVSLSIGYILASGGWQFFNYILYPAHPKFGDDIIFPLFSLLGMLFFFIIAYALKDRVALLFGIGFLCHSVGLFTAYYFACYIIGVQMPVVQLIVGLLLLIVGFWQIESARGERAKDFRALAGRIYQRTGLLFIYLSLWIMSIWGIGFRKDYWASPLAWELWAANTLFVAVCFSSLFYGAIKNDRMFFNFGLTFFIIESYTLFFSHVWSTVGSAFGSLLLGIFMISTGYLLRYLGLKEKIFLRRVE